MNNPHPSITVIKRNLAGEETWRYIGRLLLHKDNKIILEARFNMPDTNVHEIILKHGDRFIETFYTDRWYNFFEIHDLHSDEIKGWYCNVGYPAVLNGGVLSYIDLALDLLIFPDGRQLVLDEDEFEQLPLTAEQRSQSLAALEEVKTLFKS
jgi:protein associated with RNAse G/E